MNITSNTIKTMNLDYLSQLPVDLFIQQITYLPFDSVTNICKTNKTLHNYCTNYKYNNKWRNLIDNTFRNIYNYQEKLEQIRLKFKLKNGVYNHLVYSYLVKLLDSITQLMIYYRQGDKIFDSPNYNNTQRFLALFLFGNVKEMRKYFPDNVYLPYISMLEGQKIDQNILNDMLVEMAKEGSVSGVSMMLSKGANIGYALVRASDKGHLEVVKYLVEQGADIHAKNDRALIFASQRGRLEVVRYLVEHGANIHTNNDWPLKTAITMGHFGVVKYFMDYNYMIKDYANYDDLNEIITSVIRSASRYKREKVVNIMLEKYERKYDEFQHRVRKTYESPVYERNARKLTYAIYKNDIEFYETLLKDIFHMAKRYDDDKVLQLVRNKINKDQYLLDELWDFI